MGVIKEGVLTEAGSIIETLTVFLRKLFILSQSTPNLLSKYIPY